MCLSNICPKRNQRYPPYDVTLVAKDGKEFKAHRNVLSEASPFFEKLLNSDMKENKEGVIRLEILIESQMAAILQFVYTGKVEFSTYEHAEDLIKVADYLCLSSLKLSAGKFLEQSLTALNCFSSYELAEKYFFDELILSTQKFIYSNFAIVAATDAFMNLTSREVEKWISSDDIVIKAEEDVFKIILRWIGYDKNERRVKFSELFRHVRVSLISRDVLLRDFVTNDLVKANRDCFNSVTVALAKIDQASDCDVPRPHYPRKALEACVIVACGEKEPFHAYLYHPEKNSFYRLPLWSEPGHVISCRGKLFVVPQDISRARCYDPDLNRWSPAPWAKTDLQDLQLITDAQRLADVLVVKNEILFIVENYEENSTQLLKYNLNGNCFLPSIHWLEKIYVCNVVEGRYIYALGGCIDTSGFHYFEFQALPQCSRFDIKESKWQDIANLQDARYLGFGDGMNGRIFIAGGCGNCTNVLRSCEVYNVKTDEWHFIASLSAPRCFGNMVSVDETLYVLCGSLRNSGPHAEWTVECYDYEKDEWIVKKRIPFRKLVWMWYALKACSFRLFKGALHNLESVDCDKQLSEILL